MSTRTRSRPNPTAMPRRRRPRPPRSKPSDAEPYPDPEPAFVDRETGERGVMLQRRDAVFVFQPDSGATGRAVHEPGRYRAA